MNGLFNDEMANEYAGRQDTLFISDIRRTFASEELIEEDMRDQMRWHDIMKPRASHFKFRLPWDAGQTEYLDGIVYIQPYAQPQSTETRLVATSNTRRVWCHKEYEEQCFFFNTIVRKGWHDHGIHGAGFEPGSYDCAAEAEILRTYFAKRFGEEFSTLPRNEQNEVIAILATRITASIGGGQAREWLSRSNRRFVDCSSRFVPSLPGNHAQHRASSPARTSRTHEQGRDSHREEPPRHRRERRFDRSPPRHDESRSNKRRHDHSSSPPSPPPRRLDKALSSERSRNKRHRR